MNLFTLERETVNGLQTLQGYCSGIGFLSPVGKHPQLSLIEEVVKDSSIGKDFAVAYCKDLGGGFSAAAFPVALDDEILNIIVVGRRVTRALLVHELVHYRQMSSGRLVNIFGQSSWEGTPIETVNDITDVKDVVKYFNSPWEVEAHREEHRYIPVWRLVPFSIWYQLRKFDVILGIKLRKLFRK